MPDECNDTPRWFCPTPGRLLLLLLIVEAAFFPSESWFPKGWAVLLSIAAVALTILLLLFWFAVAFVFRWRFQFSIRLLMLLTVVVALPFSWLAVEIKWARKQREVIEAFDKLDAGVGYDLDIDSWGNFITDANPLIPGWLQDLLGDDFLFDVTCFYGGDSTITDSDLRLLNDLPRLDTIYLDNSIITDAGLEHLEGLKQLKIIVLRGTKVTDAGVAKLQKALPNCKIDHCYP
jgi:hypothetical protein